MASASAAGTRRSVTNNCADAGVPGGAHVVEDLSRRRRVKHRDEEVLRVEVPLEPVHRSSLHFAALCAESAMLAR
jgi:hypothetical protein